MDFDKVKGIVNIILDKEKEKEKEKEKYPMYSVSPRDNEYVRVVRNCNYNKQGEKYTENDKIYFVSLTYE